MPASTPSGSRRRCKATGTATVRRRRLPAEQVVWLVLGMGIYRNKPITEIVAELDLALAGPARAAGCVAAR